MMSNPWLDQPLRSRPISLVLFLLKRETYDLRFYQT
jgi:hypothetical protein